MTEEPERALYAARARVLDENRPEAVERQHRLGKMTARERIAALVDSGTFAEIGMLARPDRRLPEFRSEDAHADGVVVGTAEIDGRNVGVVAFDFTVLGGSNGTIGGKKVDRLAEQCMTHGFPLIMLLDGGGHRIQEGLDSRHFAGGHEFFQLQVHLSGWVPIVAVMMGPGFAGPSNFAALADFVVMVRNTSTMGVAGPALVRAATGRDQTQQELGGAEIQTERRGIADAIAEDDISALAMVRGFLGYFPSNAGVSPPVTPLADDTVGFDDEIAGLLPTSRRMTYDVERIVARVIDDGSDLVIKPRFAMNVYTALARLGGRPVGVIANQSAHLGGALDAPACDKVAHFVSLCDAFGLPLVYLIDIPGFLVGESAEATGLARRSGKLLFELGRATVPRFSVVLRKGYGLGYIAMSGGRSFKADLAVAWPSAEICAMSIEGAVDVAFAKQTNSSHDPVTARERLITEFRDQIGAVHAGEGFGVDDVINPGETRRLLVRSVARFKSRHDVVRPPKHHPVTPI